VGRHQLKSKNIDLHVLKQLGDPLEGLALQINHPVILQ
jgi:hypothetical protein